ncbi:hypothetical protein [Bacillus sp. MRMR6]|uniref:hypothetical protein n=1 Tax=Bacillus sp. MRMR6 TaxID=1928617 RepID=UPI000951260A|nr:hypothetical protein [Bacillus sp. MRMR6]OLS40924.1 hypothetical protein BTR25_06235 [Bacillus sp. MRMR6]
MRTWRVGTFSMGASLIFLGIFLFVSKLSGFNLAHVMMGWWPLLLIVLGAEILLYLLFSGQEKPVLKYDILSILFIGVLGTVGIGFAILSTSGIMGKVEEVVAREERSFSLPDFSYQTDESIKRVVLRPASYQLTIEATDEAEVSMFGTYRTQASRDKVIVSQVDEYVSATKKGDTLYVNVKTLPNETGPFYSHQEVAATILIPKDMKLEVIGNGNQFNLKPRALENDWSIHSASSLDIEVEKESDLRISAVGITDVFDEDSEWEVTETSDSGSEYEGVERNAVYQSGDGTYQININNTHRISLITNQ